MIFGYGFHTIIGYIVHILGGVGSRQAFMYGVGIIPVALLIGVVGICVLGFTDRKSKS